jgi:hypothetical protein
MQRLPGARRPVVLRLSRDPVTGDYRVPDEKTIWVMLDRLDPKALSRALLLVPPPTPQPYPWRYAAAPPYGVELQTLEAWEVATWCLADRGDDSTVAALETGGP